ncbi:ankyrin repeat domain-containing protein 13C-like isoform X2 [Pomacea canaliculata]|uniref:ankyrin repeat domain-containing protein 13C-like isoform X2 n=1 Tax=Pomacea canaliculata TaxID=400727 RepID=UPI000D729289|nr:ankyrin repeat domain-containing protein 13C-like isoform X2 [Pomacea canaliculata]
MASEQYPLHAAVFEGDIRRVAQLLRTHDLSEKDIHGNTPLHLAVMLGRKECVHLLLAHNAPVKIKNAQGWTPLAEAISYGNRQTVLSVLRKLKQQAREALEERRPALVQALREIDDFCLELKWDFHSWVPLVSRILPSDICKIYKKGACIRLDTTLVDFNDMHWDRGDISFIFNGDQQPQSSLTVLDNRLGVYQRIRYEESDLELEEEVDILMSSDIIAAQMSTKNITFSRAQSGWLFREDKTEMVGDFKADFYYVNGLILESRKRREHLSPEDVQKNKALMENIGRGTWDATQQVERRQSLTPPEPCSVIWEEYIQAEPGRPPCLGRPLVAKESAKAFKATVAMSDDFPMTVGMLLDVLEVVAPFKQFQKLRDFMMSRLPPGFPVRIEIPVFPTVTAKVTFTSFEWRDDLGPELFVIPEDYREDSSRFPDL